MGNDHRATAEMWLGKAGPGSGPAEALYAAAQAEATLALAYEQHTANLIAHASLAFGLANQFGGNIKVEEMQALIDDIESRLGI
jgi:hypothetical protein